MAVTLGKLRTLLIVLAAFSIAAPFAACAQSRPLRLDDILKYEGVDHAAIDPSGRWLMYERIRPYDQFTDYSFRTYAMMKTGHQLWRYDLKRGGLPELAPGVDPEPHSYLEGFSPSGRFLAIMQYRLGALSVSAYDMKREKSVKAALTPAFGKTGEYNPVWIADDELVFSALPDGLWPQLTSVRAYAGRTLTPAWREAWRGSVATANEVRTRPEDLSAQQEDGKLVRMNARTGAIDVIADGLYADLRVSPGGKRMTAVTVSKPQPPDPDRLVLDDARRYHLVVFDLDTGKRRALAPDLEVFPYSTAWSPDGRRIAAYGWKSGQTPRDGRFYVFDATTGAATRFDHVALDLASERERSWLQRPERTMFVGDGLAVFARSIPGDEDQSPRFTYRNPAEKNLPRADWYLLSKDGTSRNLTAGLENVSAIPVHAGNGHITVAARDGVYRLWPDGARRRLTPELPGDFRVERQGSFTTHNAVIRPEFGDQALVRVTGDGPAKIVIIDLEDGHEGRYVVVGAPTDDAEPLAGSLDAGEVLFRAEYGPVTKLFVAGTGASGAPQEIDRFNAQLANVDLGAWKVVPYMVKDPEGEAPAQTIESCVLLPPDYNPKSPPPLIVEVYPDRGPDCKLGTPKIGFANAESPYIWSGRGFAYARLTTPRKLIRNEAGPIAGMPAVIDAGVAALVQAGYADPDRVGLFGFSQGGISALFVAAHSKSFKAVIALNSWADLFSDYFGPNGVFTYAYGDYFGDFIRYDSVAGSDFGIGKTPFEDPDIYVRNSPVFLAPQIDAPVMLIHSDMDGFSMSQFDEMYGALSRAGKDARYVRYWGEGHGPSSPANIRDMWSRIDDFLAENGVAPAPAADR